MANCCRHGRSRGRCVVFVVLDSENKERRCVVTMQRSSMVGYVALALAVITLLAVWRLSSDIAPLKEMAEAFGELADETPAATGQQPQQAASPTEKKDKENKFKRVVLKMKRAWSCSEPVVTPTAAEASGATVVTTLGPPTSNAQVMSWDNTEQLERMRRTVQEAEKAGYRQRSLPELPAPPGSPGT